MVPGTGDGSSSGSAEEGKASTTSGGTTATTTTSNTTGTTTDPPPTATIAADGSDDRVDDGIHWDCGAAPPGHLPRCSPPTDFGGGGDESVCDPQPIPDVVAWVSVDVGAVPAGPLANPYVYACTITDWQEGSGAVSLSLECADGGHTLDIGTSTGIDFDTSGDFVLSVIYSNSTFGGNDQLVTLRRAGGELVLAGASTPWPPDHEEIPGNFFAPLDVVLLPDVCGIELPWDGGFVGPCFTVQRQALRFTSERVALDVYDHGVDQLPQYAIAVETAELRHDVTCTDTPSQWYSWLATTPIPD
jgi:hypothetical protein